MGRSLTRRRDTRLQRTVAIKVLPPDRITDPAANLRLAREARAVAALSHPHICPLFDVGHQDGTDYLVMEFLEGETLAQRLVRGRLPLDDVLQYGIQIAEALAAAHKAGIIHRDLKPANVIVGQDGAVKVLDFGLAKPLAKMLGPDDQTVTSSADPMLSVPGAIAGTASYMSPEQVRGQALDARTDLFSLGAVIYEMATARRAFDGPSVAVVHEAILTHPASLSGMDAGSPAKLEDIIDKALEKDRDLRYQSATELRTDLARLQRTLRDEMVATPSRAPAAPAAGFRQRPWRRLMLLASLLVLAATLIAIGWARWPLFVGRDQDRETQLTTNSSEAHVTAAAIAPDGKYIAFADSSGLHLRMIDSRETHTIWGPEAGLITRIAWFADGSRLVVSGEGAVESPAPTVWSVSILGGRPRRLRSEATQAAVSLDGSRIAFLDPGGRAFWVMGPNGEEPRKLFASQSSDTLAQPSFWWDGSRVIYGRVRVIEQASGVATAVISAETRDAHGHTSVLLTDPGLRGATRLPDGRLIYALDTGTEWNPDATVWETQADPSSGRPLGRPRRIGGPYSGEALSQFSSSRDGKRIAFLRSSSQKDVYLADLIGAGELANARRLTLDDSNDMVNNWTADSQAVLFSSSRNGSLDLFQQALNGRMADVLLAGPDDEKGVIAVDREGGWLYYLLAPSGSLALVRSTDALMRIPVSGGPPQKVADSTHQPFAACARGRSKACVLIEQEGDQLIVYALDPKHGRGARITTSDVPYPGASYGTDLSPDGSRLAIRMGTEGRIRILSLQGQPTRDVSVAARHLDPVTPYWAPDGTGFYVPSTSTTHTPPGTDLLYVDMNGVARVMWHQGFCDWAPGIPSPDGRHLAFTQSGELSNVWMLEGF